ncbi:4-(cytidine 5'-diphospho)-2-C-methyl-D-erythritol kinase [Botrimarina hoheduenensis]|uniref:4-diphosphocytidyl-2-C-methyl-D-erythritol kinase n=1 Tax=Botrimarina hoheduenensis TaxID=2528000 RepID=A0A5C5WCW8_9BACT|nr:hypothetical protein [Botrimarina hoheduenensis]TWT47512.1 4-diphosphocytidyl-2-C-methyl-D-erythritol kinase [Botrimarina hoheduenensis]
MLLRVTPNGCTALAPAKINLSLEILGRRADGFHELRTVMAPLRWYDSLQVERLAPNQPSEPNPRGTDLQAEGVTGRFVLQQACDPAADIPADASNLVVRALVLLARATGNPLHAAVTLIKRLPSQAGLGGGSSDAAAALVAANRAWRFDLSPEKLTALAAQLGSDVPFFVQVLLGGGRCRAALCEGRGEAIRPTPVAGAIPCVVVKPVRGLSTAEVYAMSNAEEHGERGSSEATLAALRTGEWRHAANLLTNTLQPAALRVAPWLEKLAVLFSRLPVIAHQLSGSGSAYFALCQNWATARRVGAAVRGANLGRVTITSTL